MTQPNEAVKLIRARIEKAQEDIARQRAAMLSAIERYSLAEARLCLLAAQLERAEERAEANRICASGIDQITFTHKELKQLWEALTQATENRDPVEDGSASAPPEAVTALDKLDAYMAGLAD